MKGKTNIELSFPIISIIGKDVEVMKGLDEYTICLKSFIPNLNKLNEYIIDSQGNFYKRKEVISLGYINFLRGFSLKFAGFGVCYVDKKLEKLKELTVEELKEKGKNIIKYKKRYYNETTLNISKFENEFEILGKREDVLRHLFFFAEPTLFEKPS